MSALPRIEFEREPFAFTLRPGARGSWVVEGPRNRCGGIFVSREAALAFVKRERRAMREIFRHAAYDPRAEPAADPAHPAVRLVSG